MVCWDDWNGLLRWLEWFVEMIGMVCWDDWNGLLRWLEWFVEMVDWHAKMDEMMKFLFKLQKIISLFNNWSSLFEQNRIYEILKRNFWTCLYILKIKHIIDHLQMKRRMMMIPTHKIHLQTIRIQHQEGGDLHNFQVFFFCWLNW